MVRHHSDIIRMLTPMFSGGKNSYGKEIPPPLPLSFDRVNEGQSPTSNSPLFTLPLEILGYVLQYVPPSSLASLALVNRDCRQLARSRQFSTIKLDYSNSSLGLIGCLFAEGQERAARGGSTRFPSIGPCVRRMQVATDPDWVSSRHDLDIDSLGEPNDDEFKARLANGTETLFSLYIPAIQNILSQRNILPHLEALDWEDATVLPAPCPFFNNLARSSIRHLKLCGVGVEENFKIELPSAIVAQGWPLQTLQLEIWPGTFLEEGINISPLCTSILRLCAPTLASLSWDTIYVGPTRPSFTADGSDPMPRFPCLRKLKLGYLMLLDLSLLEVLVHDNLRELVVDTESGPISKDFFRKRATIPCLEAFVCSALNLTLGHPLDFLRANVQLSKLSLEFPVPAELLERSLLPLLSQSFAGLTSLRLTWQDTFISTYALQMLGTLQSLKQICLSAGNQYGWKNDWRIDHNSMRKHLRKLNLLEKIAFSRDSYNNGMGWSDIGHYYQHRFVVALTMDETEDERDVRWERAHRGRILKQAKKYVGLLPKLKWLYFGQIPMRVSVQESGRRHAVTLSEERDECYTLLNEIFGGKII